MDDSLFSGLLSLFCCIVQKMAHVSYPITFPNHWTLVTGLYPENHGIIANYFWDSDLNETFNYKSPAQSWDAKWWGGEPIWNTAERQNKLAGVVMWPGCSTSFNGLHPSYVVPYNDDMTPEEKMDQALNWLDLPFESRPQFIGLYIPQIDQAGHRYGPYANETLTQLARADASIGRLLSGLKARNLDSFVHVMVVSDHGMSATDKSRLIFYDDVLTDEELSLMWRIESSPLLAIRPPPHLQEGKAVETLYQAFKRLQNQLAKPHFQVYKREHIPARYQFSNNSRIAPLLVVPDPGWNLVTHAEFDPDHQDVYHPRGTHGYDNLSPQSRAIFVAQGPTFKKRGILKPFWNVEVYQVMTHILQLEPAPNNGTMEGHLTLEYELE
ncbi:hypothetical protein EC973_005704 [Apophysomyces ossiformis]|uniref:Uncharacterized protein n=1 Tax=Apophysomyces ossiformis TaxID=679940 RepID=A0A8H7EQV8_9FUNG|nr:hypothetical protein EC973_005704 [Apophysomyces ossiformis]